MHNPTLSRDLCNDKVLDDTRLTITQKFIMLVILKESAKHDTPDIVELTVRTLEGYGVRGHGHVRGHLNKLLEIGYLLEKGTTQREDGYPVTAVRINWDIFTQTVQNKITVELLPNQDIFLQDPLVQEDSREA